MSGVPGARLEQPFDLLEHWAISTPERPYFVDGTHELSFAQAYEHARKLATALRALGVQEGEVVALELSSALQVLFIPALMQLRAATVIHRESGPVHANWLFSSNRTSSERARRTVPVDGAFLRDVAEHAELRESLPYPSRASLLRLAHSSGSTGTPKAIPLTLEMAHHRALAANELAVPGQPFMSLLDMGTASGFHTYLGGLLRGEAFYNPGNAAHNLALLSRYRVSALKLSPIQLSELLAEAERTGTPLDGLTALYCAGSVVPVALRQRVRSLGGIRLYCLYGSTEAGRCAERELLDDDTANVGQIAEGTELRIVDEAGNDVPAGQSGHVRYRRAHQAVEYFEDPFATEAAFVDGWFLTGDIGHISPRGELILDGRSNEVMNVGGVKVNLGEIERFATDTARASGAACALVPSANGVPDLVLLVENVATDDMRALAQALGERFGALTPKVLLTVPSIPRNGAGKIDRAGVAELTRTALENGTAQSR